ncbi:MULTISPECIES: glycosyltransferase [Pseudonocardia]|uniref:Galactofuranosyl transferase GlfT2 n=2 Tax=Pseudonocardia TaxID=1847 RepID=A0A1Y2N4V0_PSEAH|nr:MULTISPECIES: glycosyltransferase [Pseudonocardia]OSY42211.1 Galactofuranosyl transferase GlfT2 [Pseudonocardia autotrophica]TDN75023.1 galactofuranosylgalactofuranosylrhamnosyl-N-acetylglucosaminyl-diphospho-decaprenol beta-1,5/1,6-galactofuranosyltransferase [Pseudonocardia autotrophica]BBF98965.1 galactofuranosyl transferase GlfT2 [Pseudonocardia autotrophica]GEC23885.1 galactofuranosyl transferase GlfT2 [Pseudonocardia saturnea]
MSETAQSPTTGETLLQRVIMPRPADPFAVRALYLDERPGTTLAPVEPLRGEQDRPLSLTVSTATGRRTRVHDRTGATVPPGTEVSFGSYFNGFAAGYWRAWSTLSAIELRLDLEGTGRVDVYRTKADGSQIFVTGELVQGRRQVNLELDLRPFEDGGWYWFDLSTDEAAEGGLQLHGGGWHAPHDAPGRAAVVVGMPTFNRPADCVATLTALGSDPQVLDTVTAVILPDQGTRKVRDEAGYEQAAAVLGDRLRIIDQPNLGGSGGYARIMYEVLHGTGPHAGGIDCEQILYMDDDILLEPDSVLRAVAFSRFAREPMLVGGQMLSLQARSQLSTMGEVVDRNQFMWRPAPETESHHDLAARTLRQSPWLHRRVDVDYNAWWMCLIPRRVAEDLGLPLPLFIKWDDAEYGLRARAAGYRTATVPGIAIWHMSFIEKDDSSDWQAYFHYRNRLVAAALRGPDDPRALLRETFKRTLRHLMLMEYSAVALQIKAFTDFLAGPEALFPKLPVVLDEIRELRSRYDDGRPLNSATDVPLADLDALGAQLFPEPPVGRAKAALGLARGVLRNLRTPDPALRERPQRNVPWANAQWFVLAGLDSATVSTPDGRGVTFRRRDPLLFKQMITESVRLHRAVAADWGTLRGRYRAAEPTLTGRDGWKHIFE